MTTVNSSSTDGGTVEEQPAADGPLPEFVDWILGALIALGGLLSIVGGSALVFLVDRHHLAEAVTEETVRATVFTEQLTQAETIDLADAVVSWTGAGLLVTGVGMVLFAVGYVVYRHRARRRTGPVSSYGSHAVLGAVAAGVLSFLPFSPAAGGALAGYLERGESDRTVSVGALSGFLAVLPALAILVFVLGGVVSGLLAIDDGGLALVGGVTVLIGGLFVAAIGAGLGALGGFVGGKIAEDQAGGP